MAKSKPKFRWIEWQDWLDSENGRRCLETSILRKPEDVEYLENRLWHAFNDAREIGPRRKEKSK